jgi:hypothetical protein
LSENLSKVKIILWVCVGLYAAGIHLNYSTLSKLQAYLGQFADTSTSWFLIILDVALGGLDDVFYGRRPAPRPAPSWTGAASCPH